jgi:O-antigen/teichoic acid export membrane protein
MDKHRGPEIPQAGGHPSREDSQPDRGWRLSFLFERRRPLLWTIFISFAIVGLQMVQGILLAQLLKPEGRGEYATAVFWSQFLSYIGLFGGIEIVCRYATAVDVDRLKLRRSAFRLGIVTGLISTAAALVGAILLLPEAKRDLIPLASLCGLSVLAQNVILILTGVDRGAGDFYRYNLRRLFSSAALPTLILLAWACQPISVGLACVLFVVASYLTMIFCLVGVDRPWSGEGAVPVGRLLHESQPYAWSMLAAELFERLDVFLILMLAEFSRQGDYAAMIPVVYPLMIIPNNLGVFLFNDAANRQGTLSRAGFHRTLGLLVGVQSLSTLIFLGVAQPLIVFLYGTAFAPAVSIAWWLAPAAAMKGIVQALESFLRGRGRPQAAILSRMVGAAVMLVVGLALFPSWNVLAVALAACVGQAICTLWVAWIVDQDLAGSSPPTRSLKG